MKVFTDSGGVCGLFSYSFVVETEDGLDEQYGQFKRELDNIQEGEFKTIFLALYYCIKKYSPKEIEIYTDNLHCVQYMQGESRLRGLFHVQKEILRLMFTENVKVTFNHVYSHKGIKLNELADANATKALEI